jgi:hypothetical protein
MRQFPEIVDFVEFCVISQMSLSSMLAPAHKFEFCMHQSIHVRFTLEKNLCCSKFALNIKGSGFIKASSPARVYKVQEIFHYKIHKF